MRGPIAKTKGEFVQPLIKGIYNMGNAPIRIWKKTRGGEGNEAEKKTREAQRVFYRKGTPISYIKLNDLEDRVRERTGVLAKGTGTSELIRGSSKRRLPLKGTWRETGTAPMTGKRYFVQ